MTKLNATSSRDAERLRRAQARMDGKQSHELIRLQRDLAQTLNRATDIKEAMSISLDAALAGTTLDSGGVYLVDRETGDLNLICSRGLSPEFVASVSHFEADSAHARLVMSGHPVFIQHRELTVPLSKAEQDEGLRMMALFPVRNEDRLCVCLNVASHSLDEIPVSEREVLEAIASQIAQVSTRLESELLLRESEEKYRLLVDHSPVLIVLYDIYGNILFMNERAIQSILNRGLDPDSAKTLSDIVQDEAQARSLLERHRKIIQSGRGENFEDTIEISGEASWYWSSVQPLKDTDGRNYAVQVVSYDITERKQMEREREAAKKLEELRFQEEILNAFRARMVKAERLASVGTLSAMVAHQLSQPLTVARLSVQNAMAMATAEGSLDPAMLDLQECLGGIADATDVVQRFRDFARHSPDRCCSDIEVLALVSRVQKLLQPSCEKANLVVQYEPLASIPTFHWYEKELEQLVYILMENAIQAAPGDSPQRLVISGQADTEGLQLSFADTCGGIPESHEAQIFEPFFTTKETHKNTGLGLCVVTRILEDLGGRIVTENHPGEGVTFHLSLPFAEADPS